MPIERFQCLFATRTSAQPLAASLGSWSLEKTIAGGLLASLLILVLIGTVSFGSIVLLISCAQMERNNLRAMAVTSELSAALLDAENSERGYFLTRDPEYLKLLDRAIGSVRLATERLRERLPEDGGRLQRFAALERAIDVNLVDLRQIVEDRRGALDDVREQIAGFRREAALRLMRIDAAQSATARKCLWMIALGSMTAFVLVAGDNRAVITAFLRRAGVEVVIAEDGMRALELAMRPDSAFDLILMDMQMPNLDGYSATTRLRQAGVTMPIIALTAHAMAEDRARCLEAGCSDYLSKPVRREKLLEVVRQHLPQRPQQAQEQAQQESPPNSPANDGAAVLEQYLPMFLASLPEQVGRMLELRRHSDLRQLQVRTHQLKGAAGLYGFDELVRRATRADDAIRQGHDIESVAAEVRSLIETVRDVQGYDAQKETAHAAPDSPA